MNHLVIGALLPYLFALGLYLYRGGRASTALLIAAPLLMAIGSIWASIPDIPRLLGMHELYRQMAADPRSDFFFFHRSIDRYEIESPLHLLLFLGMAFSLMAAAWRELLLRERDA